MDGPIARRNFVGLLQLNLLIGSECLEEGMQMLAALTGIKSIQIEVTGFEID